MRMLYKRYSFKHPTPLLRCVMAPLHVKREYAIEEICLFADMY